MKDSYWKDWYWNKGGREKVQYSRKVRCPLFYKKCKKDEQGTRDGVSP